MFLVRNGKVMSLQQVIVKRKGECLKDCVFFDNEPEVLVNIIPSKEKHTEYIAKNPVNKAVQCGPSYAEHEVSTVLFLRFHKFACIFINAENFIRRRSLLEFSMKVEE